MEKQVNLANCGFQKSTYSQTQQISCLSQILLVAKPLERKTSHKIHFACFIASRYKGWVQYNFEKINYNPIFL